MRGCRGCDRLDQTQKRQQCRRQKQTPTSPMTLYDDDHYTVSTKSSNTRMRARNYHKEQSYLHYGQRFVYSPKNTLNSKSDRLGLPEFSKYAHALCISNDRRNLKESYAAKDKKNTVHRKNARFDKYSAFA